MVGAVELKDSGAHRERSAVGGNQGCEVLGVQLQQRQMVGGAMVMTVTVTVTGTVTVTVTVAPCKELHHERLPRQGREPGAGGPKTGKKEIEGVEL